MKARGWLLIAAVVGAYVDTPASAIGVPLTMLGCLDTGPIPIHLLQDFREGLRAGLTSTPCCAIVHFNETLTWSNDASQ
ncbi:MAG: hypothetical protein ACYDCK_11780 [Thermoplasmatota archaeon]